LFAYIGNKRALLPFLREQFSRALEDTHFPSAPRFYDPFAGTGAASRLARMMGMDVHANDWEFYSSQYNRAYLVNSREDAEMHFSHRGGLQVFLDEINRLGRGAMKDGLPPGVPAYISAYYAPPKTEEADYRHHRLFYTAENARFIDTVRHFIDCEVEAPAARNLLLALLLYQAGTHANTSGVFKAYHKGFGGLGRDALGRIMRPMSLPYPVLPTGNELPENQRCEVTSRDAAMANGRSYDLVYLDPPYNGHQYGSNYFMLNTIARWDKPPVDQRRGTDGRFVKKAAIREDWVDTRSEFCYADRAPSAFTTLLENLDSPRILLSYNTEGIIPFDQLTEIMSRQGRLQILTREYTTYRGGRQSAGRKVRNMEFILYLDRRNRSRSADMKEIRRITAVRRLERLAEASFDPRRVPVMNHHTASSGAGPAARIKLGDIGNLHMPFFFEFSRDARQDFKRGISSLDTRTIEELVDQLESVSLDSHIERAEALIEIIRREHEAGLPCEEHVSSLLWSMNKFSFRKYRGEFFRIVSGVREDIADKRLPDFSKRIDALERRVAPRLSMAHGA
jgi:adenine-specific DNA-methyltransferase